MNHFDKREQVILELAFGADRSNREIARKLNVSEGLVRAVRKVMEASGKLQVKKRHKGGRPPKQSQSPAPTVQPVEGAEPFEVGTSELVVSAIGEVRQRLQQRVVGFVEQGKVSALDLVKRMSVEELDGVISDLEKGAPSHQEAPATAKPQAKPILGFEGDHRWLSNFWPAKVALDGMEFSSVEHAYQAAKTPDREVRAQIAALPTPGKAKRFGRRIQVRPDWDGMKLAVMEGLLRQKFAIPELRAKLLDTGDAYLEETNSWQDFYWGVCDGRGENHLGKLLMKVRDEEFVKEGLTTVLVTTDHLTEAEAREAAEEGFGEVNSSKNRHEWIDVGKEHWANRRASGQGEVGRPEET